MSTQYALVLGCDVVDGGNQLGPRTVERLKVAKKFHHRTAATLVVASPKCRDFPQMRNTMAQMMQKWLQSHNCKGVVVLEARSPDTKGEIVAFMEFLELHIGGRPVVISFGTHLTRVRHTIRWLYGSQWSDFFHYEPVEEEQVPWIETWVLEPIKHIALYFPPRLHHWGKETFRSIFGNPSWRGGK